MYISHLSSEGKAFETVVSLPTWAPWLPGPGGWGWEGWALELCGGDAQWEGRNGESQQALLASVLFFPAEVQPPLEDNPSQENTEDLKMQIPEEPSPLDQPVTRNMGVLEVSQKPNTEKDVHPGKAC